jgi:hypothetical protein
VYRLSFVCAEGWRYNLPMRIPSLRKHNRKNPNGYFNDLPPQARLRAWQLLAKFEARWRGNLPRWRKAILIGQAKRLALNPPTSEWGRSMLSKRGGYAVQRKYLSEGRTGKLHPANHATRVRVLRQQRKKRDSHSGEGWTTQARLAGI